MLSPQDTCVCFYDSLRKYFGTISVPLPSDLWFSHRHLIIPEPLYNPRLSKRRGGRKSAPHPLFLKQLLSPHLPLSVSPGSCPKQPELPCGTGQGLFSRLSSWSWPSPTLYSAAVFSLCWRWGGKGEAEGNVYVEPRNLSGSI